MNVKELIVKPIKAKDANDLCIKYHYSKKVVPNSQIHLGVFYNNIPLGVMQFGPSINKKGTINLVKNTSWNGFIELNRMAFSENLPKNSESRCLGYAFKLIKKNYPHIKWIVSFSDACQSGDGAIYRATGFVLTDIRANDALRENPNTGEKMHIISAHHKKLSNEFKTWKPIKGYQLRYIKFLDENYKKLLTVEPIPFTRIKELGIGMYKGEAIQR